MIDEETASNINKIYTTQVANIQCILQKFYGAYDDINLAAARAIWFGIEQKQSELSEKLYKGIKKC